MPSPPRLAPLLALAAACSAAPEHPIDALMADRFAEAGHTPADPGAAELCRRLSADLLGRLANAEDVASCAGRSVDAIVRDFQARREYLDHAHAIWRDRLGTLDITVDWRDLRDLYAQVDALHRGELRYGDFATEVLAHPGFVLQDETAVDRARRAFTSFLGRRATDAEAYDFAALYLPWFSIDEIDPDFPYPSLVRYAAGIAPGVCEEFGGCTASLLGGGTLALTGDAEEMRYADLDASQLDALREPGRVVVRQPYFWEAGADEILDRLLGWSDGGTFPREPGILLPDVRQVVADHLRQTGSYSDTERLVLTSVLYRQRAETEPDGLGDDPAAAEPPVWTSGPVKPARAEVFLDTAASLLGVEGACDPRYPDSSAFFLLYEAWELGELSLDQLQRDIVRLHELQGNRTPLYTDEEDGIAFLDLGYTELARQIGGCPGVENPRQSAAAGLARVFAQETLAEILCSEAPLDQLVPPDGDGTLAGVLAHQMRALYGRDPTTADLSDFERAYAACAGDECSDAGRARGVCVALVTAAEMSFY
jgi:hypothetical protein